MTAPHFPGGIVAEEKNWYLADLRAARTTVQSQIDTLLGDQTTLEAPIIAQVVDQDGWVCESADDWIVDVTSHCSPILTGFTGALDDLDAKITVQAREPMVDEGDWRGLAWRNTH